MSGFAELGRKQSFSFYGLAATVLAVERLQSAWRGHRLRREMRGFVLSASGRRLHALLCSAERNGVELEHDGKQQRRTLVRFTKVLGHGAALCAHPLMLMPSLWVEALDSPQHRYGGQLKHYHDAWLKSGDSEESFFVWLDNGGGRSLDLPEHPRATLEATSVMYCNAQQRRAYAVVVGEEGRLLYRESRRVVELSLEARAANPKAKLIFVLSPDKTLFVAEKRVGHFHHSSFMSGGTLLAAGSMVVDDGELQEISPHSGHYRPSDADFARACRILEEDLSIPLSNVRIGMTKKVSKQAGHPSPKPAEL